MSTEMPLECSLETLSFIYLDVVDGMNVLHCFLDDLSRLKKGGQRLERQDRLATVPVEYPDEDQ